MEHLTGREIVARTLLAEARGEGITGMQAAGNVIAARAALARKYRISQNKAHPLYGGGTAESACLVRWQFSCWNDPHDPNYAGTLKVSASLMAQALALADRVIRGDLEDLTGGATHYLTTELFNRVSESHWAKKMKKTVVIGRHTFLK